MKKRFRATGRRLCTVLLVSAVLLGSTGCHQKKETVSDKKEEKKVSQLSIGVEDWEGNLNPLYATAEADKKIARLTQAWLLTTDASGGVVSDGITGASVPYGDASYTYKGISNIEERYDSGANTTTYTIRLRDNIACGDGTILNADDLIFTYYVLCDLSYNGEFGVKDVPIEGLSAYRYNNADSKKFAKKLKEETEKPSKKTKSKIKKQIIAKNLKKQYKWVASLYESDTYTYYTEAYPEQKDLFAFFFSLDDAYDSTKVKDGETVLADIIKQYGADYKQLGEACDEDFSEQAEELALETLLADTDVSSVPAITGITKQDDSTVQIVTSGFDTDRIYQLCDIPVLSLRYYGDTSLYSYNDNTFGFPKGNTSAIEAKTAETAGAGPYQVSSLETESLVLDANPHYWDGAPSVEHLIIKQTEAGNIADYVSQGLLDMAVITAQTDTDEQLVAANSTETLIHAVPYSKPGLVYAGINAAQIKVGKDASSAESKALRLALATVLSVYRTATVKNYYHNAASPATGMDSSLSWITRNQEASVPYQKDPAGAAIYTEQMSEYEKYDAALAAAVEYFKKAGFTYDANSGIFTAAPKGASLSYKVTIAANGKGEHAAYAMLTSAREALESIGITLVIQDISDSNILWNAIDQGTQQIWIASMPEEKNPHPEDYYLSANVVKGKGTRLNYFSIRDANLDALLQKAALTPSQTDRASAYSQALQIIEEWGVMIPLYHREHYLLIHEGSIKTDSLPQNITAYYDIFDVITKIESNVKVKEDTAKRPEDNVAG